MKILFFAGYFFLSKFVGIVFVFSLYDLVSASMISSHVITEPSLIFANYLPFSQLHIAVFQV